MTSDPGLCRTIKATTQSFGFVSKFKKEAKKKEQSLYN